MTLRQVGEEKLLAQLAPRLRQNARIIRGVGDDCAVLKTATRSDWLVLKTDAVVAGVHFPEAAEPQKVGWKAMMRPLSDFAAMSGLPEFALITLAISPAAKLAWVRGLYRGLSAAAARFAVAIVGGETSATRGATVVAVSVSGRVEPNRCIFRDGGKLGDELFVTGSLGGSRAGRHLKFVPRIREARWLTSQFKIHAMMDLSDGLGTDLPRLARASKLGFAIDQNTLPVSKGSSIREAISDGEDYELLFAISPRDCARLKKLWRRKFPRLRLTRIGRLNNKAQSADRHFPSGYAHFRQRR
jgi:thiamine-monophosphate kinase